MIRSHRALLASLATLWLCLGCEPDEDPLPTPDAAALDPDAAPDPDAAALDPDAAALDPDAAAPDPDAAALDPDATVDPDATEPEPDGALDPDAALEPDAAVEADAGGPDYERDPDLIELDGPCPADIRYGGFKVESNDAEGYTAIDGQVKDGIVAGQLLEETLAQGGCALMRRPRLICEPSCEPGNTCDAGNQCVPIPRGQDMGPVDFHGLVEPLTLEALQPGNTYFFTRLPHPGFEPGTVIYIDNTPGFVGPLDLYGVGVAPLVVEQDAWVITEGEPLQITWDPPPDSTHTRMYFELNIDQHGLTPVSLVCSLPDNGVADVPVAMTDALIAAGVTGFPTGRMARRTTDSALFDGRCVDFVVSSVKPIDDIEVTGFRPCIVHEDCPDGPCNLEIQQCE